MPTFSARRSEAIRLALEDTIQRSTPAPRSFVRRWMPGAALLVIGIVTGGAVSAAAVTSLQPKSSIEVLIAAPPGVIPGQPIISLLGTTTIAQVDGSATLELPAAPAGATHLRVTFTCITVGTFAWGTDPNGNNPSMSCGESDIGTASSSGWYDFPLDDGQTSFFVTADTDHAATLAFQYVNYVPTALGVNQHGDTFGGSAEGRKPDLVAVIGVDDEGAQLLGYSWSRDLDSFGPDWPGQPSNPKEALAWQAEREARYPNGWDIPVYESDGTTRIGTFHVG